LNSNGGCADQGCVVILELLAPSFIYTVGKDLVKKLAGRKRRLTPSEVMALRSKWKPQFGQHISDDYREKLRPDVIIRDMKRLDKYPDLDENEKGISPWFRLGLVGTYHRGILVALSWGTLTKDEDGWRYTDYKGGERGDLKVILISSIPYENIEQVDWDGDEYYGYPHIYCWFNNKKVPYEHTAIYVRHEPIVEGAVPWFEEVADIEDVRRRSKKHGLEGHFG
jgi:hypothetical protein